VFGKILYTTLGEKIPAQNALFLFIPATYYRGWTLIRYFSALIPIPLTAGNFIQGIHYELKGYG
jgi:hypothetical protein